MKKFVLIAAAVALVPAAANAQDFTGGRAELRVGWETPTVSGAGEVFKIGSGPSFGGEVGADFRLGRTVVAGPYATFEASTVKECEEGDCLKVDNSFAAGGRVGFQVGGNGLIYGKLGYARIKLTAEDETFSESETEGGIEGGLGFEMNFGRIAYGKIEATYADYGKFFGINLQRRHVAAGVGLRF
ncbi:MAG TPA: outer membrane beta-barrel protein [Sphingomicrobium sp.]|nr:outer membrane beta-barrel protein [Sphingomicrobium sp.]